MTTNFSLALAIGTCVGLGLVVAPASAQTTDPSLTAAGPKPNLYIYRENVPPAAWSAAIKLNGVTVAKLANRHFTALYVRPGTYTILVDWNNLMTGQNDVTMPLTIEDGKPVYMDLSLGSETQYAGLDPIIQLITTLTQVTPDDGAEAVKTCCIYEAPKIADFEP